MSMEIHPLPEADSLTLPLPLYVSVVIAEAEKDGEAFAIVAGLTETQAGELKKHALDESDAELQDNTSDRKRFGEGMYSAWYAKGRTVFGLVHKASGALAAVAWFGPETFSGAPALSEGKLWHTVAYRSYNPFRGKGLMKRFARFAMETYLLKSPQAVLWAGIHSGNAPSVGLAEALGFARHSETDGQIIVVRSAV